MIQDGNESLPESWVVRYSRRLYLEEIEESTPYLLITNRRFAKVDQLHKESTGPGFGWICAPDLLFCLSYLLIFYLSDKIGIEVEYLRV